MIFPPLKPTLQRYHRIFLRERVSIYRALMNEEMEAQSYSGKILDFGGGRRAHYFANLTARIVEGVYISANIDADMEPTYVTNRGMPLPVEDEGYDMLLSFNTLEYVYNVEETLADLARVVRPGGRIVLGVPFLFRVHGKDDYHRQTAHWWEAALARAGFEDVEIRPLCWDFFSAGLSLTEGAGPLRTLRRWIVPLYGLLYAKLRSRGSGLRYNTRLSETLNNAALGYVITGSKRHA